MTNNNNDRSGPPDDEPPRRHRFSDGDGRIEPGINGFDDGLENYEEPDRDTDFTSGYAAEELMEEETVDDLFHGDPSEYDTTPDTSAAASNTANTNEAREPVSTDPAEQGEQWYEEDYLEEGPPDTRWPLPIIIVAAIALVILAIGVYGILQERAEAREELRELRATLATSVSQADIQKDRDALRDLQRSNRELAARAEALAQENRMLQSAIDELEASLSEPSPKPAQAAKPATRAATPSANTSKAAAPPTRDPGTQESLPATPRSEDGWFVNFGSYTAKATAETWSARLQPSAGKVVVAAGLKDGKTYYRVRVIGLGSRDAGNQVARELEAEQGVSRLWVGQD